MRVAGARSDLIRDLILMGAIGVFLAVLGPYGTGERSFGLRLLYWPGLIYGGGVVGIALDELWGRRISNPWLRWTFASVLMTPAVTLMVWWAAHLAFGGPMTAHGLFSNVGEVMIVCFAVMGVRQVLPSWALRPAEPSPNADAGAADALAAFRLRLTARHRAARLFAVEAEDHYLRVHTDQGSELISGKFADALAELAGAPGFQTHRSWWIAGDAIEAVRWRRGRGELVLSNGLVAPVSRTYAAALKAAGWF